MNDRFKEPVDPRLQSQKTPTDEDDIEWKQFIQQQPNSFRLGGTVNQSGTAGNSPQPAPEAANGEEPLQAPEPLAPNGDVPDDHEAAGEKASSLDPLTDKRSRRRRKRKAKAAGLRTSQPSPELRVAQAPPQASEQEPSNAERLISPIGEDQPPPLQSPEPPQPSLPVSAPKRKGKRVLSRKAGKKPRRTVHGRKGKIRKRPRALRSTKAVKPRSKRAAKKNRMRRGSNKKKKLK